MCRRPSVGPVTRSGDRATTSATTAGTKKKPPVAGWRLFVATARQWLLEGDLLRRDDVLVVLLGNRANDGSLLRGGANLAVVGLVALGVEIVNDVLLVLLDDDDR